MTSKFKIGEEIICKEDFYPIKRFDRFVVTEVYNDLIHTQKLIGTGGGYFSQSLFESIRKIRIDKINTILDDF